MLDMCVAAIAYRGSEPANTTTLPHCVPWTGNCMSTGILGATSPQRAQELGLPTHAFPWSEQAHDAGIHRDAAYLVRPDGYVAAALSDQSESILKAFIDRFRIRFASHS